VIYNLMQNKKKKKLKVKLTDLLVQYLWVGLCFMFANFLGVSLFCVGKYFGIA
jgi:hypothetical protein